jgi:GNAT superfamily N-acetyltransferase
MQDVAVAPAVLLSDSTESWVEAQSMTRNASDQNLRIERIDDLPVDFDTLIVLSLREDFFAMQRMRDDWDTGANRFDGPGEILFEARVGSRLVGICGLNRDPYARSPEVGRVRHLYVDPECRRRGVGRSLVFAIVEYASRSFVRLRLRTLRADLFYVALGFRRIIGDTEATHEMAFSASATYKETGAENEP